jgi:hypothetical protein
MHQPGYHDPTNKVYECVDTFPCTAARLARDSYSLVSESLLPPVNAMSMPRMTQSQAKAMS